MAKRNALTAGNLNWQQTRFCEQYVANGGNGVRAYLAAGYSPKGANAGAARLLASVSIQEAIGQERERLQSILNFKREDQVRILHGMATARIDDFTGILKDHTDRENWKSLGHFAYAVEGVERSTHGVRIKLCDRMAALNHLSEILGLNKASPDRMPSESTAHRLLESCKRLVQNRALRGASEKKFAEQGLQGLQVLTEQEKREVSVGVDGKSAKNF